MSNTDLILITRPKLNLTMANIIRGPKLLKYIDKGFKNIQVLEILSILDSRLKYNLTDCKYHDAYTAFIPLPDTHRLNDEDDLEFTYDVDSGLFYTHLYTIWMLYLENSMYGGVCPYEDLITLNDFDYLSTMIFRITLNDNVVENIITGNSLYPQKSSFVGTDIGIVTFKVGSKDTINALYDKLNLAENIALFNSVVRLFNPAMVELESGELKTLELVGTGDITDKFKRYPHINENTNMLEWYIKKG